MSAALIAALRAHAAVGTPMRPEPGGPSATAASCTATTSPVFVHTGTSISDGTTLMAWIDWDAVLRALHDGQIPACGGERRILQLAASIAEGFPVPSATPFPAWTTGI